MSQETGPGRRRAKCGPSPSLAARGLFSCGRRDEGPAGLGPGRKTSVRGGTGARFLGQGFLTHQRERWLCPLLWLHHTFTQNLVVCSWFWAQELGQHSGTQRFKCGPWSGGQGRRCPQAAVIRLALLPTIPLSNLFPQNHMYLRPIGLASGNLGQSCFPSLVALTSPPNSEQKPLMSH